MVTCENEKGLWWRYCAFGAIRFATNYIARESLLKKRADLKKIFISDEWASHKLVDQPLDMRLKYSCLIIHIGRSLIKLVLIYEVLYAILRIVDSEIVPTMSFVYELIWVMKQNLHQLNAKD